MTSHDIHFRHWTDEDKHDLEAAGSSLEKMKDIAIRVIRRLPKGVHLVSGPITTGGVGTPEGNLLVFKHTIERLADSGLNVFSQAPFEKNMLLYHAEWSAGPHGKEYCWPILNEFYAPLFASRDDLIFHFIDGYASSTGARWEESQCDARGFKKIYLSPAFSAKVLAEALTHCS